MFGLLLVFTLMGSVGSFFFKRMSSTSAGLNRAFIFNFVVGCGFYGMGAILNIIALQYTPYTILFPLTSITYIWTFLLSAIWLQEKITVRKMIGLSFIVIGSFLLVS